MIRRIVALVDWRLVYNPIAFMGAARAHARAIEELRDRDPAFADLYERASRLYNAYAASVLLWVGVLYVLFKWVLN